VRGIEVIWRNVKCRVRRKSKSVSLVSLSSQVHKSMAPGHCRQRDRYGTGYECNNRGTTKNKDYL